VPKIVETYGRSGLRCPKPCWELTTLLRLPSWWAGGLLLHPQTPLPLSAFGLNSLPSSLPFPQYLGVWTVLTVTVQNLSNKQYFFSETSKVSKALNFVELSNLFTSSKAYHTSPEYFIKNFAGGGIWWAKIWHFGVCVAMYRVSLYLFLIYSVHWGWALLLGGRHHGPLPRAAIILAPPLNPAYKQ